ncbi:MAG: hypothetical protein V1835_00025 [Candidatus Micrarchaeota archaeon]
MRNALIIGMAFAVLLLGCTQGNPPENNESALQGSVAPASVQATQTAVTPSASAADLMSVQAETDANAIASETADIEQTLDDLDALIVAEGFD